MRAVLIVDDERTFRDTLAAYLRIKGYDPLCAANGVEALELLEQHKPALMVLDLAMPVMDGLTLLEILRRDLRWKNLPVIALTGRSDLAITLQAANLGVKECLLKATVSLDTLMQHIQNHMRVRSATSAM